MNLFIILWSQDYKGWTPLITAANQGLEDVVNVLITLGAKVDFMPDLHQAEQEPQYVWGYI